MPASRRLVTDLLRLLPELARAMQAQRQYYLDELERQPLPSDLKEELRQRGGVTQTQIQLAIELVQEGGAGVQDLANRIGVTKAAISRLVDRMAERGLVTRERDTRDTRKVWVRLTPDAEAIVETMLRVQRAQVEQFLRDVPEADQALFVRHLAHFVDVVGQLAEPRAAQAPSRAGSPQ